LLWDKCEKYLKKRVKHEDGKYYYDNLNKHILNRMIHSDLLNISGNAFIKSVRIPNRGLGYSMFPLSLLSDVCKEFNKNKVFDPFAGWGHRLLDAHKNKIKYTGIELNVEQSNNLQNIADYVNSDAWIINDDCMNFGDYNIDCDIIFSCPAYDESYEKYGNGVEGFDNMSLTKYKTEMLDLIAKLRTRFQNTPIFFVLPTQYGEWLGSDDERLLKKMKSHYTKTSSKTESLFIWK
jgi:hypothetical protein